MIPAKIKKYLPRILSWLLALGCLLFLYSMLSEYIILWKMEQDGEFDKYEHYSSWLQYYYVDEGGEFGYHDLWPVDAYCTDSCNSQNSQVYTMPKFSIAEFEEDGCKPCVILRTAGTEKYSFMNTKIYVSWNGGKKEKLKFYQRTPDSKQFWIKRECLSTLSNIPKGTTLRITLDIKNFGHCIYDFNFPDYKPVDKKHLRKIYIKYPNKHNK